ncbi:MAG TPA: kelch repeat-containing protein, partial [Candidatus Polarisedimenticolia bacterium]|nr:kelch repeat-containing protein [Candidatus Polarisedimenticolia bacterium]
MRMPVAAFCRLLPPVLFLLSAGTTRAADRAPHPLDFEARVRAQAAIERVYYSHQIGAKRPFEQAVPRALLERKVQTYLKQSIALERFWKTSITSDMLRKELERIARGSRMPDRLLELYAALEHDPLLIQECLARPALVGRLTQNFFTFDHNLHAEARREAEAIHRRLLDGLLDPRAARPGRVVVELLRSGSEEAKEARTGDRAPDSSSQGIPQIVDAAEFDRWAARASGQTGRIETLREERERFVTRVLLEARRNRTLIAVFVTPKVEWDRWWKGVEDNLDAGTVKAVSPDGMDLPIPGRGLRFSREGSTSEFAPASPTPSECAPDTWDNGALDDLPEPRSNHTAVWTGSLMIIWGGGALLKNDPDTGGRYDPATDTWTSTSTLGAPSARSGHKAVWTGSEMIIWWGVFWESTFGYLRYDGGRYDPLTDTWTPISTVNAPHHIDNPDPVAVWTGTAMLVWGLDFAGLPMGARYNPSGNIWTPISNVNAPSGLIRRTAVWAGTRMIVWGGGDCGGPPGSGGRYDPSTDTWIPVSTTGAPAGGGPMVWTGSEMILWNDSLCSSDVSVGARYDPVSDIWMSTSTEGAPSSRHDHTAVWTGSEMIIWGGHVNGTSIYFNTGGRYNPATDSWTATSTVSAPSARSDHTAVWTGTQMIVLGGSGDQTGGRYDPAADSWTPTSHPPPTARYSHIALWTGNQMIVWGGYSGEGYLGSGSRYDPALDTWTPIATLDSPSPRANHSGVWTGDRMLVWGGYDGTALDSGGRYDPVADTWSPTSPTNVPAARYVHSAVWTGTRMIV